MAGQHGAQGGDADIVADILARCESAVRIRLRREMPAADAALVDAICHAVREQDTPVRKHWHGEKHYVPLRPRPSPDAKRRALDEVNTHGKVANAAEKNGMSKTTLYAMLANKPKRTA